MMNYTRDELLEAEAATNQIRNAVFHLARFMSLNKVKDIKGRLRQMGRNIAKTYITHWKPVELVNIENVRDVIATIYKEILNSSVSIELNQVEKLIIVKDSSCALCKYKYEEIKAAGCEILLGLISEFITLINGDSEIPTKIDLKPKEVLESRTFGNSNCVQVFEFIVGGEE
jgi:predicted hydrocarbon binding protein